MVTKIVYLLYDNVHLHTARITVKMQFSDENSLLIDDKVKDTITERINMVVRRFFVLYVQKLMPRLTTWKNNKTYKYLTLYVFFSKYTDFSIFFVIEYSFTVNVPRTFISTHVHYTHLSARRKTIEN